MRISDWSSDVCSSDLPLATATSLKSPVVALKTPLIVDAGPDTYDFFYCFVLSVGAGAGRGRVSRHYRHQSRHRRAAPYPDLLHRFHDLDAAGRRVPVSAAGAGVRGRGHGAVPVRRHDAGCAHRSEAHTSELKSLMRLSYAVFCLKKKKK